MAFRRADCSQACPSARALCLSAWTHKIQCPKVLILTQNNEFARAYSLRFESTDSSISNAEKLAAGTCQHDGHVVFSLGVIGNVREFLMVSSEKASMGVAS